MRASGKRLLGRCFLRTILDAANSIMEIELCINQIRKTSSNSCVYYSLYLRCGQTIPGQRKAFVISCANGLVDFVNGFSIVVLEQKQKLY